MSDTFKVELSRARAIAICVCAAGACVLLFVAGTASGLLMASNIGGLPIAQSTPVQPQYKPVPAAEKTGSATVLDENTLQTTDSFAEQSGNPPSLAVLSAAPTSAAPLTPTPEKMPSPIPAPSQAPVGTSEAAAEPSQSGSGYGIPLAVKVCSFSTQAGADNLASLLESRGYHASVTRAFGAEDHLWYVVTVGPYKEWNAATSAAAHVAIIANVQPVVAQLH
ncbi:MAG: SPOR domain-containing protein [Terracidiphilus sp.]